MGVGKLGYVVIGANSAAGAIAKLENCAIDAVLLEYKSEGMEERVSPPDTGHGFLWRLYSYWRLQEHDGGVVVECRALSLTRDVPFGLGWAIEPIITKLPKETLINILEATRQALHATTR